MAVQLGFCSTTTWNEALLPQIHLLCMPEEGYWYIVDRGQIFWDPLSIPATWRLCKRLYHSQTRVWWQDTVPLLLAQDAQQEHSPGPCTHVLASSCTKSVVEGVILQTPAPEWDLCAHHYCCHNELRAQCLELWQHQCGSYSLNWILEGTSENCKVRDLPSCCAEHTSPSRWGASAVSCCMETDFSIKHLLSSYQPKFSQSYYLSEKVRGGKMTSGKIGNQRCFLCTSEYENYWGMSITSRGLQVILRKISYDTWLSQRNYPWLLNKLL